VNTTMTTTTTVTATITASGAPLTTDWIQAVAAILMFAATFFLVYYGWKTGRLAQVSIEEVFANLRLSSSLDADLWDES